MNIQRIKGVWRTLQAARWFPKSGFSWGFIGMLGLPGLLLLGFAWGSQLQRVLFEARALHVSARIVTSTQDTCLWHGSSTDSAGTTDTWVQEYTCYAPVVQYEHRGQVHTVQVPSEHSDNPFEPGKPLTLLIGDAQDEPRMRFLAPAGWGYTFYLTFLGLAFLGGAALGWWMGQEMF